MREIKPTDVFPSFRANAVEISIDKVDLDLPDDFNGTCLMYSFVETFFKQKVLPIVKERPQGIALDTYRQRYQISVRLKIVIEDVVLLPEVNQPPPKPPIPPNPSGFQQLRDDLHFTNSLQLRN